MASATPLAVNAPDLSRDVRENEPTVLQFFISLVRLFIVKAIPAATLADAFNTLLVFHFGFAHAYQAPQNRLKGF
jgi:hypothetical protein